MAITTASSSSSFSLLLNSLSSLRLSNSPSQITLSITPPSPKPLEISQTIKYKQPIITQIIPKHSLNNNNNNNLPSDLINVLCPGLANSNPFFFKSAYNLQVIVGEHEPEEKLIGRFRREVLRAGIIQECKRRRYFETNQEKRKRKTREAAKRNRKRRPILKAIKQDEQEDCKKIKDEEDNWDFIDVDLPYS